MDSISSDPFDQLADRYDSWFDRHPAVFQSEIDALKKVIPQSGEGLEIGVGSGRFAKTLGIKTGIDPSEKLLVMAKSRGINVFKGVAESLPFSAGQFDYILLGTVICFLKDPYKALSEVKRVLKPNGILIVALLEKNSQLVKGYEKRKDNPFYRDALFYTTNDFLILLNANQFKENKIYQTIFSPLEDIKKPEIVKSGHGEGAYVIIQAEHF